MRTLNTRRRCASPRTFPKRSPFRSVRHLVLKRITGFVLALCFGLFTLEVAIADVHDGDASAAEVAKAPVGGGATSTDAVPNRDSGPGAPTEPAGHETHVCHCVHAHGGWTPVASELPAPRSSVYTPVMLAVLAPTQVDLDVHLRPPIA